MRPSTRVVLLVLCLPALSTEARVSWDIFPTLNLPDLDINHSFNALSDLIKRLPKAELHVHIEGTLDTDMMFELAAKNQIALPYADKAAAVAAREHFTNLQDFLDAYNVAMTVLVDEDDFYQLTKAYLDKAAANNITHVEIFFDAQHHLSRGLPLVTMVRGMQAAIAERRTDPQQPVDAHLILCLVRELGEVAAAQTLVRALPYVMDLTALGLASAEVGNPPGEFRDVYRAASLLGLHKVAHAGEEGGPEYVWEALKVLGVERVDHGIHTLEDPTLVQYMADNKVPITLCPLSNLRLQVYAGSLEEKIKEILSSGIVVTLNSDDPAYFGGYLNANYEWVTRIAKLGPNDIAKLAANSFAASFIPPQNKLAAYVQISAVLAAWKAEQLAGSRAVA